MYIDESSPQDHRHDYINMGEADSISIPAARRGSASILD
jgi:hypothetical protein